MSELGRVILDVSEEALFPTSALLDALQPRRNGIPHASSNNALEILISRAYFHIL